LFIDSDGTPYRGKLLTDGLERYDEICAELKLLHFGCMQQYLDTSFIRIGHANYWQKHSLMAT
jgi:hypothetical protein